MQWTIDMYLSYHWNIPKLTNYKDKNSEMDVKYDWVFTGSAKEMFELAKVVSRRLKVRDKLLEGITWGKRKCGNRM